MEEPPRRIAVFRALVLGDMLCAVPAWRALKARWPRSRLTLVGLPWAQALAQRLACIDDFIAFPGWPGLPESQPDIAGLPGFLADVQARRFDLVVQMHGSGLLTNPLVASFGAKSLAVFQAGAAWRPEDATCVPWPEHGHEIERCMGLAEALGAKRQGLHLELPLRPGDFERLGEVWPGLEEPFAIVHAGAQLPSRRWPPDRFADVADRISDMGLKVVLTGTASESGIAGQVQAAMRSRPVDLVGRTDLWTLGALVARASLVLCNDTGLSHVAAALGTPSVVVSLGSDVARWAPLDSARHAVLWQDLPCRPCAHRVCPTAHECASAIGAEAVAAAVVRQLQRFPSPSCPRTPNAFAS